MKKSCYTEYPHGKYVLSKREEQFFPSKPGFLNVYKVEYQVGEGSELNGHYVNNYAYAYIYTAIFYGRNSEKTIVS